MDASKTSVAGGIKNGINFIYLGTILVLEVHNPDVA